MAMPTLGAENRTLLSPQLLLVTLDWLSWPSVTPAVNYGNEVTVWIEQGQAVAISMVSGRREISLDLHETVTVQAPAASTPLS